MQPVTTRRAPSRRGAGRGRTGAVDSCRAGPLKGQGVATTRSASSGESAASKPSTVSAPTNLSESTWFFGQPKVSIQYRSATGPIYRAAGVPALQGPDAARAPPREGPVAGT